MKFTLSTKPFSDALDLGVINANISKFYLKSCLAQLTADNSTLRINLEASYISSEILLKGSGELTEPVTRFVDCVLLKQLVSTFESGTTTIEFVEGGIILHSGSSKFTLSNIAESADIELKRPNLASEGAASVKIDKGDWKFIKDHQMYAIATSFVHPVYTRVWLGDSGDVIVGDFDNSLFTFSKKNKLGSTCLVSDTIVNLFNSLPDNAILTKLADSYRIDVKNDAFEYASEFTPQHESDPDTGSYSSNVILEMAAHDDSSVKVNVGLLTKFLSQADLLGKSSDDSIKLELVGNELRLFGDSVDCKLHVESTSPDFVVEFRTNLLKSVLTNLDEETIYISPMMQEDAVVGILVWTSNMSVVLGGIE